MKEKKKTKGDRPGTSIASFTKQMRCEEAGKGKAGYGAGSKLFLISRVLSLSLVFLTGGSGRYGETIVPGYH